jgi:hypothetical protein
MPKKIEEIQMTHVALSLLPEYSCSLPAMTTIGNRWKRNTTFDTPSYSPDGPWLLGEYVAGSKDSLSKVAIFWRKIVLLDDQPITDDGIFVHECITPGCDRRVEFDDEPWCFTHSPDEGSSVEGYSFCESLKSYEVIEILVKELDKHGHGDFHYDSPGYRNLNVLAALAVGRAWLAANPKE